MYYFRISKLINFTRLAKREDEYKSIQIFKYSIMTGRFFESKNEEMGANDYVYLL